jgi:hypothetical protein
VAPSTVIVEEPPTCWRRTAGKRTSTDIVVDLP